MSIVLKPELKVLFEGHEVVAMLKVDGGVEALGVQLLVGIKSGAIRLKCVEVCWNFVDSGNRLTIGGGGVPWYKTKVWVRGLAAGEEILELLDGGRLGLFPSNVKL